MSVSTVGLSKDLVKRETNQIQSTHCDLVGNCAIDSSLHFADKIAKEGAGIRIFLTCVHESCT